MGYLMDKFSNFRMHIASIKFVISFTFILIFNQKTKSNPDNTLCKFYAKNYVSHLSTLLKPQSFKERFFFPLNIISVIKKEHKIKKKWRKTTQATDYLCEEDKTTKNSAFY